jgi:hypothetical protein
MTIRNYADVLDSYGAIIEEDFVDESLDWYR